LDTALQDFDRASASPSLRADVEKVEADLARLASERQKVLAQAIPVTEMARAIVDQ